MHYARKRFGQNFLHDNHVIERIMHAVQARTGEHFVEIGPGKGALTRPLLQALGALDAIELDRDLVPLLQANCGHLGELVIHQADALKFDYCALADGHEKLRVIGNLPYNISTPLIFHLLDQAGCIRDMHFMLQKEVVERMAAAPGSKAYGRLSVMAQIRCSVDMLFTVGSGAFLPAPKVDSAIVRLTPYAEIRCNVTALSRIVTSAFAMRRKTLRNNLKNILNDSQIQAAGIDPGQRAEMLSLDDFIRLSKQL